jgi:hydrocephalus-inducing protein
MFSSFRLQPLRGVNFSAVKYGQTVTRSIELKNEGEFDFVYSVVDVLADDEQQKTEMQEAQASGEEAVTELKASRDEKQKAWLSNLLDPSTVVNDSPLTVGPFTIEPANGVIVPGATTRITLNFVAEGSQLYRNPLRFDISGRAPNNQSGRTFEVVGESCIPGIDAESFESIFEEQSVVPRLEFNEVETDDPDYANGPKRISMYAEEQGTFSFGAVVPSQSGKLGVAERLKISNHNKIKCVVKFSLTMRGVDEGKTEETGAAFRIQPASIELPPHEHRYVTVYFKPSEMRSYTAAFEANVEDGTEPRTRQLRFDVTGEGTLPCVTVEQPTAVDTDGSLMIDYNRANAGKSKTETISLRNAGTVSATLYFDMELNNAFTFPYRGRTITLPPRGVEQMNVTFNPPSAQEEPFEALIKMTVMQNEYEATKIRLKGIGYLEDLAIEGLPGGSSDEINFGQMDVVPGALGKQISFTLKNDQPEVIKFEFPEHSDFKFSPSIGHIHSGKEIEVFAEFLPESVSALKKDADDDAAEVEETPFEPIVHEKVPVNITVTKLEHKRKKVGEQDEEAIAAMDEDSKAKYDAEMEKAPFEMIPHWDNSQTSISYNDEGEKSVEVAPEPEHEVVGEPKEIAIKLSGSADTIQYECATNQIAFRPTMMFQTRSYKFTVSNPGKTTLSYDWALKNKNQKGSTIRLGSPSADEKGPSSIACPFTITPQRGTILASGNESFVVRFAPMEVPTTLGGVFNYDAKACIENLAEGTSDLVIDVRGAAQRPICHFELPSTHYLEIRPADMPGPSGNIGPLDPSIKVIYFESLGTNIKNTLRFKVINPTNMGYDFMWEAVGNPHPAFNNAIKSGTVLPGRRHEQIFEYTPSKNDASGYQESFWRFMIPRQGVDQLFLVAGTVNDPRVTLDRTFVNFGNVLMGNPATEVVNLINREDLPFAFNFDKSLLRRSIMSIDPMSGVVPGNAKLPVKVVFNPADEKPENLSVACVIRRKPTKLSINLKGEGAGVHDTLTLFDDSGGDGLDRGVELATAGVNYVDFGQVHINDTVYKRIVIQNSGKFNLDFKWSAPKNPQLKIHPLRGMVRVGDRLEVKLSYHPINEVPLGGVKLSCDVAGTHKYALSINGQGAKPMLDFSFIEHNFGPCFVPERGGAPMPETAILRLTNNEMENDVAFDCLFEKLPHLEVQTQPTMLRPTESIDIPIIFTAREVQQYHETIKFELNGLYTVNVIVRGEGCLLKVELANPTQSLCALGTLRVGQDAVRKVLLVNKSKRAAKFTLEDVMEAGHGRLEDRAVSFFPRGEVTLAARAKTNIEIRFNPLKRISPFKENLNISVVGSQRKLLTVTGSCQGIEVTLESDAVPFGSICEGCRISKKLQMENSGDLGTKFKWDNASFGPDFSISPAEGFLSPHSGVVFDVLFHPTRIFDDFRRDRLMCMVDGAPPLFLTLSGACEAQPSDNVKEMEFETRVRGDDVKVVTISNPTTSAWVVKPAITNEYWTGGTHLNIPAKGSGDYEVTYKPLTMTRPGEPPVDPETGEPTGEPADIVRHEGSVFFPLPDGTALLYKLYGTSSEPTMEDEFEKTAAAKEKMVFEFPVKNWMKKAQRFHVTWDDENDRFHGANTLDVPGNGLRTYKLSFFGLKEGESFETKVTFKNQDNGEYLFYNIKANVTAPIIMGSVSLSAPVRQTVQHVISIENPLSLDKEVNFEKDWWTCEDPCVRVRRLGEMTGKPECNFEVEYRPLVVVSEPKEVRLTITSVELGDYHYTLVLTSEAAASERALQFKAALGSSHVQTFRFRNMVQGGPTTYKCVYGNPDAFEIPTTIEAEAAEDWEGRDVMVTISFEPIALGEVRDTLRVVSDVGGEFVCSLYGNGVAPRPQGPFLIANGATKNITFKNVFNEARDFSFVVDNPRFSVNVVSQKLDANKEIALTIKFEGPSGDGASEEFTSGKLYVSCPELKALPPWIYYLRGQNTQ